MCLVVALNTSMMAKAMAWLDTTCTDTQQGPVRRRWWVIFRPVRATETFLISSKPMKQQQHASQVILSFRMGLHAERWCATMMIGLPRNSSIQCLSNIPQLREFFLTGTYKASRL